MALCVEKEAFLKEAWFLGGRGIAMDYDREYILDHYRNPRNYGRLEHPHMHQEGINPLCGDRVAIDLQIDDAKITAVRFQGRGCSISQASASILTEMIEGRTVQEAARLDQDDLLDALGIAISPARTKCAFLSLDVLHRCLAEATLRGAATVDAEASELRR
jgi:nitrogen fixation protein NifU and related proteins